LLGHVSQAAEHDTKAWNCKTLRNARTLRVYRVTPNNMPVTGCYWRAREIQRNRHTLWVVSNRSHPKLHCCIILWHCNYCCHAPHASEGKV